MKKPTPKIPQGLNDHAQALAAAITAARDEPLTGLIARRNRVVLELLQEWARQPFTFEVLNNNYNNIHHWGLRSHSQAPNLEALRSLSDWMEQGYGTTTAWNTPWCTSHAPTFLEILHRELAYDVQPMLRHVRPKTLRPNRIQTVDLSDMVFRLLERQEATRLGIVAKHREDAPSLFSLASSGYVVRLAGMNPMEFGQAVDRETLADFPFMKAANLMKTLDANLPEVSEGVPKKPRF